MKRREFVTSVIATGLAGPALAAQGGHRHGPHDQPLSGPLAHAVVAFGSWPANPAGPLDRFPSASPPPANQHVLLPNEPKIRAGGAITFALSGLHNVQVFAPGTRPEDINTGLVTPMTAPPGLPIIDDPANRVYRGLDPSLFPEDRVESVRFLAPGRYLVICGFLFHFQDNMFGYVNVVR